MLLGVGAFNIIDRTVINLLLVPIGKDLQLSDTQLGLFAGTAFGIFYACAQIPIARFADRKPRGRIISMALTFWSAMTLLQSSATGFLTLALTRAGVAIGEAGSGPASMSMLADLFPPHRRTRAFAILAAQAPIGAAIGALVAGFVARSDRLARRADARRRSRTDLRRDRVAHAARTHARLLADRPGRAAGEPAPDAAFPARPAGVPPHAVRLHDPRHRRRRAEFRSGVSRARVPLRADSRSVR